MTTEAPGHAGPCTHEHPGAESAVHLPPPPVSSLTTRAPLWFQPVLVGFVGLAACVLVAVRDPNVQNSYGICPFKAMTGGLDCPGCGIMRGSHALFRGQFGRAIDHNIFLPFVLGAIVVGYVRWFRRSLGQEVERVSPPRWATVTACVLILGFWVVRNLGGPFSYLDSEAAGAQLS